MSGESESLPRVLRARYRVVRPLGAGGFAQVFLAVQPGLEREVVIKILMRAGEEDLRRFRRETRALLRIDHPCVPRLLDVGEHDGQPYLVTPYEPGETLAELCAREGPRPPHEVAAIAADLASALEAAHTAGVLHRDVKPANVLVTAPPAATRKRALLLDFGVARAVDDSAITNAGGTVGTPGYIAPEQLLMGRAADARADLWSLGATLYHALTARDPFAGTSLAEVHALQLNARITSVPREGIPPDLERLVVDLLKQDPQHRPGSAADVVSRLSRSGIDVRSPVPSPADATTTLVAPPRVLRHAAPGRARWPAALAAAVLGAGLLLVATLARRAPPATALPGPSAAAATPRPDSAHALTAELIRLKWISVESDDRFEEMLTRNRKFDFELAVYAQLMASITERTTDVARCLESAFRKTEGRELLPLAPATIHIVLQLWRAVELLRVIPGATRTLDASPLPAAMRRLRQVLGASFARGYAQVLRDGAIPLLDEALAPVPVANPRTRADALEHAAARADALAAGEPGAPVLDDHLARIQLWKRTADEANRIRDAVLAQRATDRVAAGLTTVCDMLGWPVLHRGHALEDLDRVHTELMAALDEGMSGLIEHAADRSVPRPEQERAFALAMRCGHGPLAWYWQGQPDLRAGVATLALQAATDLGYRDRPEHADLFRDIARLAAHSR